jgi:GH15 family glucan-1,4-alpha-glucosidase
VTSPSLGLDQLSTPHVLREYALLADGERGVVVGPRGDFAWMCFPAWDSDAIFSSLIGGRGIYAVTPQARFVWGGYYEDGTLIWRSRWVTTDAVVECREALVSPGAPDRAVVLRQLTAVEGVARANVVLNPRASFGRDSLGSVARVGDQAWTARTGATHVRWCGTDSAEVIPDGDGGQALVATLVVEEGSHHDLVLELSNDEPKEAPLDPARWWTATETTWSKRRAATPEVDVAATDVRRAYAVLDGLTCATGGMVAAATTSLPERAGEGRSYDYRYVWIRDQCLAGRAVAAGGAHPLVTSAVRFVTDRLLDDGPRLQPAYTTGGGPIPRESALDLPGYPGGTDIVGNRVGAQFQLDAFGESLLLLAAAAGEEQLDARGWRAAAVASQAIADRWTEPDAGIWELDPARWTESRLSCAAGLRAMSAAGAPGALADRWSCLADAILSECLTTAVHPSGRFQRAPGDPRVDAGLLLPLVRGALPPGDARAAATVEAVRAELAHDGFVYRYAPDDRPLGDAEGAFVLCGFLLSLACIQRGDVLDAVRYFERNRLACGPPGLFSEEFDVGEQQLRGNLPQAFAHALLVESALRQPPARRPRGQPRLVAARPPGARQMRVAARVGSKKEERHPLRVHLDVHTPTGYRLPRRRIDEQQDPMLNSNMITGMGSVYHAEQQ